MRQHNIPGYIHVAYIHIHGKPGNITRRKRLFYRIDAPAFHSPRVPWQLRPPL